MYQCKKCGKPFEKTGGRCSCGQCLCYWCTEIYPRITRIEEKLSEDLKKDLDFVMSHYEHKALDGNVAECKLDGSWHGWEWIIEEKKKRTKIMIDDNTLINKAVDYPCPHIRKKILKDVGDHYGHYSEEYYAFVRRLQEAEDDSPGVCLGD